jgi:Uma2 family endonuclease
MNALARRGTEERDPRLWTADQFLEFYMTRPDGERWQLIDGLAIMMLPPSMLHQRVVGNLSRLLNDALGKSRPDLFAYENIGLRIPGVSDFNPQPDIAVCSSRAEGVYYQERFYLVAEVFSPSNRIEMTDRKLELYRTHPDNLYCLTLEQDAVHVALYAREQGWSRTDLRSLDDMLELSAFGFEARLADIYEGTPLTR